MAELDKVTQAILKYIDEAGFKQEGAFNLRHNGVSLCHGNSEHVKIVKKQDKEGIDIYIDGATDGEEVHIPVVLDASGVTDKVYNDFHIEAGANVKIIAGCGIHNDGHGDSQHNGVHSFFVGEGANVTYTENHYGEGDGKGAKILNPVTKIFMEKNSVFTLDTTQIKGVDSTKRETEIEQAEGSKLYVLEKLMTHGNQLAESNMEVRLNGEGSSAQIISRSVAKENSHQIFHPAAVGNAACNAHIQCDSIIMDEARVRSIPEIDARHLDAAIVHEAAIGRINDEQLTKLRTMGMTAEEAESIIIEAFLN